MPCRSADIASPAPPAAPPLPACACVMNCRCQVQALQSPLGPAQCITGEHVSETQADRQCLLEGACLSVTMSSTAPSVEDWLKVRAARPSVSSSTNLRSDGNNPWSVELPVAQQMLPWPLPPLHLLLPVPACSCFTLSIVAASRAAGSSASPVAHCPTRWQRRTR